LHNDNNPSSIFLKSEGVSMNQGFPPNTAAAGSSWFPKTAIADPIVAALVSDVAALRAELEEAKREIAVLKAHDEQNKRTFYIVQDMQQQQQQQQQQRESERAMKTRRRTDGIFASGRQLFKHIRVWVGAARVEAKLALCSSLVLDWRLGVHCALLGLAHWSACQAVLVL
jgi:hypothetical protein